MPSQFILTAYVEQALSTALYDKLEDGSFSGRIPDCTGVIAFGNTLHECANQLRSTLEEWILLGLKLGHPLPVLQGPGLDHAPNQGPCGAEENFDEVG